MYQQIAEPLGLEIVQVDEEMQPAVHDAIYNPEDGIKTLSAASERVRGEFEGFVRALHGTGVNSVILGCTEIPIALPEPEFEGVALLNPMAVLARCMIEKSEQI